MVRPIAFGTVTRDALPDQIAQRLIALITEKHLKPGDRLPPERELSAAMGVSRSSLREALRALAMLGVAEMRMRPVGLVLALSDAGLTELFEARKLVEPGLAYLAAERISEEAAEELSRCARASADVLADADAFMWHDIELHALIARAADNAILARLLESVASMGIASRRVTGRQPRVRQSSVQDHLEIAAAIAAHDPEEARDAMLRHLENVERAVNG